jgi:hypothetical protein
VISAPRQPKRNPAADSSAGTGDNGDALLRIDDGYLEILHWNVVAAPASA